MKPSEFLARLHASSQSNDVEKAVEQAVTALVRDYFERRYRNQRVELRYPHNTDGVLTVTEPHSSVPHIAVLFEVKRDMAFSSQRIAVARVVAQALGYLRRMKDAGEVVPAVSVIADLDEMFAIPTSLLRKHLEADHKWHLAPSSLAAEDPELVQAIFEDPNVRPYVHRMDTTFDVEKFCTNVALMAEGSDPIRIPVHADSLTAAFTNFRFDVLGGTASTMSSREAIRLFIDGLQADPDVYPHPNKPVLVRHGKDVDGVDLHGWERFWSAYDSGNYTLREMKQITEIADTLIEDTDRRFRGDFWTPKKWVDKAHELMAEQLGENYLDDYVFWDMAAGSKNLTRDYRFGELYTSTLNQTELDIAANYNREATAFQYDFLNDDMSLHLFTRQNFLDDPDLIDKFKLPAGLVRAMVEQRPIVFFANPPYGQASTIEGGNQRQGIAMTAVRNMMMSEGTFGHANKELYAQFIYRVQQFAKVFEYERDFHIFFFTNKGLLTSSSFGTFAEGLTSDFTFRNGFMLNAGEFNGTSSTWGITFSGWEIGGSNQREFDFRVLETQGREVCKKADWTGRMVPRGASLPDWAREGARHLKAKPDGYPRTVNGLDAPELNTPTGKDHVGSIGHMTTDSPNVQASAKYVANYSMAPYSAHKGMSITRDNFERAAVTFSIRRAVYAQIADQDLLWVRDKDIFVRPPDSLLTDEFIADSVVLSLFDSQSKQTSLRGYEYGGKKHRVVNEFFPFSIDAIEKLAVKHRNMNIQYDIDTDKDRFVHQWLQGRTLSAEAQALMDAVWQVYVESFPLRALHAQTNPRYQAETWDAGWLQIRTLAFGQDRLGDTLLHLKPAFDEALKALRIKIAEAYEQAVNPVETETDEDQAA